MNDNNRLLANDNNFVRMIIKMFVNDNNGLRMKINFTNNINTQKILKKRISE